MNSSKESKEVCGYNVYVNPINQYIYYHPLMKKSFLISKRDEEIFTFLQFRHLFSMLVIFVSAYFIYNWSYCLMIGVFFFMALEIYFLFFLKKCTPTKYIPKKLSIINNLARQDKKILLMKAVTVFGILGIIFMNILRIEHDSLIRMILLFVIAILLIIGIVYILTYFKGHHESA